MQIPTMQGSAICCHEHFIVVSDVNNGVMTTPAAKTVYIKQLQCNTVAYDLNSCRYKGAKLWNDLPNEIKNSITLAEFKNQI